MRLIQCTILGAVLAVAGAHAQVVLTNGADITMQGSAGSRIVFPDGTVQSTAASGESVAGHGGLNNTVSGTLAFIGGGQSNTASGNFSVVNGGRRNVAEAAFGVIGGGGDTDAAFGNTVSDRWGTVAGGRDNRAGDEDTDPANSQYASVGGGKANNALGYGATIAGGVLNTANFAASVGGGRINAATGNDSTIGGGRENTATGPYATISGGVDNWATSSYAAVGGGFFNVASALSATVAGGNTNSASAEGATVAGGTKNIATSDHAAVLGGSYNSASADHAVVAGGFDCDASQPYSFAAGYRAKANGFGSFVWADTKTFDFVSGGTDSFRVRATGGVQFVTAINVGSGVTIHSVTMDQLGNLYTTGSVNPASDRNAKENFAPVDAMDVLEKVAALPIATWNYREQDADARHMGPTAQDFAAAFSLGNSDKHIATVDADGVALAAIQGLNAKLDASEAGNAEKQRRIDALEARLAALEARLADMEP